MKDGINNYIVHGFGGAVNPASIGTKVSADYKLTVGAGESVVLRLRLTETAPEAQRDPFGEHFDEVMTTRLSEADEFYASVIPSSLGADEASLMRQALAGMLWSKQLYYYDVDQWLEEHGADPFKPKRRRAPRNEHWHHMCNAHIISMPDKWEYPWYAAWDLAFHVLALTLVDPDFGKRQLDLMLQGDYLHPNGQIPAYEWNFGDVNPPVHAWSTIFAYRLEKARSGQGDVDWLERSFQKLLLNFTWWVNRKDRSGNNVFEGGFLGLDNIGVFDRSAPLPTGGYLEQADGTAWMALFCQNMLEIASQLALERPAYMEMSLKFAEHFLWIASSMIIRALLQYYSYYGHDFTIECPTGAGRYMTLYQVAQEIVRRLASIFLPESYGRRPVYGGTRKFQNDPHWRDYILFYEYFHGDNGAGLGASHQTGGTGIIARTMHLFATTTPEQALEISKMAAFTEVKQVVSG